MTTGPRANTGQVGAPSTLGAPDADHPLPASSASQDSATQIETHGIAVVPDSDRNGRPSDLFSLWFGGNIIFTYLLFGGILIALGLPLVTALLIGVICNLAWILVGLLATVGPKTGTASMVVSRVQYGYHGNKPSCLFNWLVQVGYEGVDFALAALAAYSLAAYLGWHMSTPVKAIVLLLIIAASFIIGLYGKAAIFAVQKINAWGLGVAAVLFVIFLVPHVKWTYHPSVPLHGAALTAVVLIGISVILSGPLSYPVSADYARYLPRDSSSRAVALYTAIGGYLPTVVLTVIGILAATVADPNDFTTSMRHVLPGWFYPIFLLIIVVGLMANSIYSIYSSGLTLQAIGVRLSRPKTVWFDATIGTGIAVYGVLIASNFLTVLQNFLLWSIYWLAPFFGIYMAELLAHRGRYDAGALHRRSGPYWYGHGIRWGGVCALALGMACAALLSNTPYLKGPLSTHLLHGGDLSAVGGLVIGAGAYWVLCLLPESRRSPVPASLVEIDEATRSKEIA